MAPTSGIITTSAILCLSLSNDPFQTVALAHVEDECDLHDIAKHDSIGGSSICHGNNVVDATLIINNKANNDKRSLSTPTPTTTNAFNTYSSTTKSSSSLSSNRPPPQCHLYLAPSSLPKANLGLYSGISIPIGSSINEYIGGAFPGYNDDKHPPLWTDLYIPIADHYKSLPFRGQQRFPSWLSYIWPQYRGAFFHSLRDRPFPDVPVELWDFDEGLNMADGLEFYIKDLDENDEKYQKMEETELDREWMRLRVSALAPGIASLANSHLDLCNIDMDYENSKRDYAGMSAPWDAGAGAFTPHHNVEFKSTKKVEAGMELLLNYGSTWHQRHANKMEGIRLNAKGIQEKKGFVEGINKKWSTMEKSEKDDCPKELPTEEAKRERLKLGMAVDSSELNGKRPYTSYRENTFHPSDMEDEYDEDDDEIEEDDDDYVIQRLHKDNITKPLTYLAQNGICLSSGKLRIGRSSIPDAGRGVFATTNIPKGEVILPSPLLAMRRDDFKIYKSDPDQTLLKNVIDKKTVKGEELLLNYAFGQPESPMLLVPTAPLANFINHGGPFKKNKTSTRAANARIRWPEKGSNTAKLFGWAFQNHGNAYDKFNVSESGDHNPWLKMHPIDVMERSGKLAFEYVALRNIRRGEEILIDYGPLWDFTWNQFRHTHPYAREGYFRHYIGVPFNFYPEKWRNVSDKYELTEVLNLENGQLEPGKVLPLTWAHNGKPVSSKYAYVVGLPEGFSDKLLKYSESKGVIELYRRLLTEQEGYKLASDGFSTYQPGLLVNSSSNDAEMEFFAHRYHSKQWHFNMHFVAAWDETARKSVLSALGDAGFDYALKGIGERFGYDNLTCFHASYMGMSHCDNSKMHSDIYATEDKSWNLVFPLVTVEGSEPELDILAEDMNTVIGVNYFKDIAYVIGDFGYHQTRPSDYYDPQEEKHGSGNSNVNVPIRVVFGAYCAQIDETNVAMIRHIYDGDDPAPFADQFVDVPMREIHWDKSSKMASLVNPKGAE